MVSEGNHRGSLRVKHAVAFNKGTIFLLFLLGHHLFDLMTRLNLFKIFVLYVFIPSQVQKLYPTFLTY